MNKIFITILIIIMSGCSSQLRIDNDSGYSIIALEIGEVYIDKLSEREVTEYMEIEPGGYVPKFVVFETNGRIINYYVKCSEINIGMNKKYTYKIYNNLYDNKIVIE